MILADESLIRAIYDDDRRDYGILISVRKKLGSDETDFTLRNADIKSGGLTIESTACGEDEFPVGRCIVRKLTLTILNASAYDGYNFVNRGLVLVIGYPNPTVRFGYFKVASQSYDGNFITLVAYDSMCRFDAKFTGVTTPITAYALMQAMIPMIGWTSQTSPYRLTSAQQTELQNVTFSYVPTGEDLTCRDVMEYMLQFLGYNLKTDSPDDRYVLSWFDFSVLENATPTDEVAAQTGGYNLIRYPYTLNMERQDRQITGVRRIYYDTSAANVAQESHRYMPETLNPPPGFIITVEGNPMVEIEPVNASMVSRIYDRYAGQMYRKASFTHVEDPRIEAGDVGLLLDTEGNYHPIIFSSTKFQMQNAQNSYSSTAISTNSIGFSEKTKTVSTAYNLSKVHSDANADAIDSLQTTVDSHTNALSAIGTVKRANLASTTSIPDATATTLCNVSLTAGTWVIIGKVTYQGGSAGTYRQARLGTTATGNEYGLVQFDAASNNRSAMIGYIAELTAARTVYLNTQHGNNSATNVAGGATNTFIQAVRIK